MRWARIIQIGAASVVLGALVAAVSVVPAYRRDHDAALARIGRGSAVANTRCGPIEYSESGSGTPVLVVHGAGGGFDQGQLFADELVGHRAIAMSRFGYLGTPLPADASAAAQADAHACLLDALRIDRAAIIGISAGAPSAIQFALRHPGRTSALVLLVPATYAPRPDGAPPVAARPGTIFFFDTALRSDFLMWSAIRWSRRSLVRSILGTPPEILDAADPTERARAAQLLELIQPVSQRRDGLLNDGRVVSALPRYPLEKITAPTLALSAADDLYGTYDGARYSAEHIPGARFVGFPNGGHLWIGHRQRVIQEVNAFLDHHP